MTQRVLSGIAIACVLGGVIIAARSGSDTSGQLGGVLLADKPVADQADKLTLFGQFVGAWDVDVVNHNPDGTTQTVNAEWHFGWILEGRAVQDVWQAPT